ncbi:MAG: hypothetical protein EZS28_014347 [Streblomastix strix]|uniref:Uncharacterized protein n=1 Tax=Streblomastix strix TaxID=222440 RepID=A0A5J4W5E1_9EUKA|nr:MAG: hypothetical protein EZS28_014347 [Streblomastix strix]
MATQEFSNDKSNQHSSVKCMTLEKGSKRLYGINNESIRVEGLGNIRQFNKLSANAEKYYGQAASSGERKPNLWILTKILKYHNKKYFEQTIKQLLKKNL